MSEETQPVTGKDLIAYSLAYARQSKIISDTEWAEASQTIGQLLEAAKLVVEHGYNTYFTQEHDKSTADILMAAIAKAEGRQS